MTGSKEATIKARTSGSVGILNRAIATFQEAPFPVKLAVGTFVGGGTIAILSGCSAQSKPCEISSENLDPKSAARPITIVSCNPEKEVSVADQTKLKENYGADLSGLYLWAAVNKGSGTESVGDGTIAFSTYSFENGRSMVVFPSGKEDYSSEDQVHEYTASWFETADGKILYSYSYTDELNPNKAIGFFTVEWKKPEGVTLADLVANGANPSKALGNPTNVTVSNPPAHESITYNIDSKNPDDIKLLDAIASLTGASVVHALGQGTATVEASTPIPALDPIKIGTESIQPAKIVGFTAYDESGKPLATQGIDGEWIKITQEIKLAPVTPEDWTNLNTRLGTDFAINTDGVIPGVDGVTINKDNGEVTFNFNGKGPEKFDIRSIKVQEINGVKRFLVAGYAWNSESKSWEVYNPGFPMESPEAQVGWFNEADVPNGNWLRWDQRAKQDLAIKAGFVKPDGTADVKAFMADIFKNVYVPTEWGVMTAEQSNQDFNYDGINDLMKFNRLWWKSDRPFPEKNVGGVGLIMTAFKKDEMPIRSGLSYSLLIDSKTGDKNVLISSDILNGDPEKTVTTVATMVDLKTFWTERKSDELFERLKGAFGLSNKGHNDAYMIWPITSVFPGASAYYLSPELNALARSQGGEIEAMISGTNISPQISLRVVPAEVFSHNIVLSRK